MTAVAIAPDGTWLATGSGDRTVRIWDPATGQPDIPVTGDIYAVAFAPDGTWLATGSGDQAVRIWDPATGQQRAALTGHAGPVTAVAIASDGTWLATVGGGYDGTVRIWDPATAGIGAAMRVDRPLADCAWSPSGQSLVVAGDARHAASWPRPCTATLTD